MKWGRRRARGPDGLVINKDANYSEDYKRAMALKKINPKELSNSQLKILNERLQFEQTLSSLSSQKKNAARKWLDRVLNKIGDKAIDMALKEGGRQLTKKLVKG